MDLTFRPISGSRPDCLLIPKPKSSKDNKGETPCQARLVEQHSKLYVAAGLCANGDKFNRATIDIMSIMKCFPAVTSEQVILSIAAWFTVLCNTDDAVEKLDFDTAQLALAQAVKMLQSSAPDDTPATREATHTEALEDTFAARVPDLAEAYRLHIRDLLPQTMQDQLRQASSEALEAMALENQWRQRGSIDETTYMSIRVKTIGIRPMLLLVQHSLSAQPTSSTVDKELASMISDISLAIGLQNDLIGLERDIERGELFNYVLRLEKPSADEREARILKAIDLHNDAIHRAVDTWESLKAESDAGALACAECFLKFVERHYLWATTSKRYKSQQQDTKSSRLRAGVGLLVMRAIMAKASMRRGLRLHVHKSAAKTGPGQNRSVVSLHGWTIRMELKESVKSAKETSLSP